jgi:hypothetical protein
MKKKFFLKISRVRGLGRGREENPAEGDEKKTRGRRAVKER